MDRDEAVRRVLARHARSHLRHLELYAAEHSLTAPVDLLHLARHGCDHELRVIALMRPELEAHLRERLGGGAELDGLPADWLLVLLDLDALADLDGPRDVSSDPGSL